MSKYEREKKKKNYIIILFFKYIAIVLFLHLYILSHPSNINWFRFGFENLITLGIMK